MLYSNLAFSAQLDEPRIEKTWIFLLRFYTHTFFRSQATITSNNQQRQLSIILWRVKACVDSTVVTCRLSAARYHSRSFNSHFGNISNSVAVNKRTRRNRHLSGARAFYAGVMLRTFWITISGFIYLGALEQFNCENHCINRLSVRLLRFNLLLSIIKWFIYQMKLNGFKVTLESKIIDILWMNANP